MKIDTRRDFIKSAAIGADYLRRNVMSFGGRLDYDDDGQIPNSQIL